MNRRHLRAGPLAGLCLILILLFVTCDNPAGGDGADTTAAAAKAARDSADSFYAAHRGVIDTPADTLTLGDTDPVNAALEAYQGLQANARILLAEEKARLDLLKSKLDEMLGEAERGAYYNLTDLLGYLMEQEDTTPDEPCAVAYCGDENIIALYKVLTVAGKYTALDLSKSGVYGFATGTEGGRELIVSLVLPDTLTETPDTTYSAQLFSGYVNLKTVSAAGLTRLGSYTFYLCSALATVNLPKAVTIDDHAFDGCISLTTVNLPEAITLGTATFNACASLATVTLPKAATIGEVAFTGCTNLTTVNLPEATTIGTRAFQGCASLASLGARTFESKIVSIGASAFAGCSSLAAIVQPEVTFIGERAFAQCTSLVTVSLPKAASIGNNAFGSCARLDNVDLPKAISIGNNAFIGCAGLAAVTLPVAADFGQNAFQDCAGLAAVTLPKVESIGNNAFTGCVSLATVTLGTIPPTAIGTTIFSGAAMAAKTITIKAPQLTLYTISPWSDKLGANNNTGGANYFWDNNAATRDNLTVALEAL
jgi:hypothetical protein